MKAFVAGATGYTGREVVRILCERGVETVAHIRPDSSSLAEWQPRFEAMGAHVDTTPWESEAIKSALVTHAPDRVFGLLGTTRARKKTASNPDNETYLEVDYALTSMLVSACEACPEPPAFIFLSSYGIRDSSIPYVKARYLVEEELRKSSLRWLVARPAIITGDREESRFGEEAAGATIDVLLKGFKAIGVDSLYNKYGSLDATTLAAGLVHAGLEDFQKEEIDAGELRRRAQRL